MKITIQRDRLVQSVNDVLKAVSTRTTIPILTGIKIKANEEGVTLTGSDSDISIESFIPAEEDGNELVEIKEAGSIVLPARFFAEIVKKLPESTVDLEVYAHLQTIIRSGKAEYKLNGLNAEDYPQLPQMEEQHMYSMPIDLLKNIIRQTIFAVSTSETRPVLTGVNWRIEDGQLICIATDSHRLAMRKTVINGSGENYSVVVPGKSLSELSKILDDTDEEIKIIFTENQVLFKSKNLLFFSRLLEGNYPDTSRLIPNESKTDVRINTKELLHAIDRASLLARESRNNVVKLSTMEASYIEISSHTPEVGTVTEEIVTQMIEGEELKISFSAKYMMDALKALDVSEVTINFTGAMRPFVLKGVDDDSMLQLILPVRTY